MTKEDVHNNLTQLFSRSFKRADCVFGHTSGTTGKSLQFYQEPHAVQFHWAVWSRHKRRFGVEFDAPCATFTGLTAVPLNQDGPPYWRENWPMHQTIFTMHHIVPNKVRAMVERLNQGGFVYYSGYPSILYAFAVLIEEHAMEISAPPKMIFTGAENLYEDQRQVIARVFKAPVTDQYGFTEGAGNASRCPYDLFHEDFEYGILECLDPEPIDETKTRGRIIATGFASYAMPFLRYEVGDIGVWETVACPCGRQSKVLIRIE